MGNHATFCCNSLQGFRHFATTKLRKSLAKSLNFLYSEFASQQLFIMALFVLLTRNNV